MQLTLQYKEKRRVVDEMKEDLQKRIAEYAKTHRERLTYLLTLLVTNLVFEWCWGFSKTKPTKWMLT